jgi:Ca2+-binding RTX toxin-like protein
MATTTDPLLALLADAATARWNFPAAIGSPWPPGTAGIGTAVTITYSFPASKPSYATEAGFSAFTQEQKVAAREVLATISAVANVRFTETTGIGDITFANGTLPSGVAAYAYLPQFSPTLNGDGTIATAPAASVAGDVWVNGTIPRHDYGPGEVGFYMLMHEMLHALGFKHAYDGLNTLDPALSTFANTLLPAAAGLDLGLLTVSGTEFSYVAQSSFLRPRTPMPFDIAALQYLYGANTATRAGDSVYRWETSPVVVETLWDGGGRDLIDCSNQVYRCVVDLRGGAHSSIGLRQTEAEIRDGLDIPAWYARPLPAGLYSGRDNVSIAPAAVIENATGGSAADTLSGNGVGNFLRGGGGNDVLDGRSGDDTLDGGSGADRSIGGAGNDVHHVRDGADVVVEAAGGGTDAAWSFLADLTLGANVEDGRIMASGASNMAGNGLNNVIAAGAGDNLVSGGAGVDTLSYQYATAAVRVSLANAGSQATGGSGIDTLSGFENLAGSAWNDRLTGSAGANTLDGGAGMDTLAGGAGADNLAGRRGNDLLVGGSGRDQLSGGDDADVFDFDAAAESGITASTWDVITDFQRGVDRIDLRTIDANAARLADQSFSFIGTAAFGSNAAGQLRFEAGVVYGSTDADAAPEFAIRVLGASTLAAADFML